MKLTKLKKLFHEEKTTELAWEGECHDCKKETSVTATLSGEDITISGGAIYETKIHQQDVVFIKCIDCYKNNATLTNFQPVEVYSRCVGYYRPVDSWNKGKQAEFGIRKTFNHPTDAQVA